MNGIQSLTRSILRFSVPKNERISRKEKQENYRQPTPTHSSFRRKKTKRRLKYTRKNTKAHIDMTTIFPFVQISKHLKFGTSLTLIVEKKTNSACPGRIRMDNLKELESFR